MDESRFERRLDEAASQWRNQRYTGPMPVFSTHRRRTGLFAVAGTVAAAIVALILLRPAAQDWPEELRPVLRGSPLAASAPEPPANRVAFKLPNAPERSTCFALADGCDKPAG